MPDLPATKPSRVAAFLEKTQAAHRGRLVFIVDATGSREQAWDMASKTQAEMFQKAAGIGMLNVQLIYFRGLEGFDGECKASRWTSDARELASLMARITCKTGHTQIQRALEHVRKEHQQQPVSAVVYIGDMCEEKPQTLYDMASGLGVPCFMFHEGEDRFAAEIFREIARLSHGAYYSFRPGAADQLRDLLQAVGAYAAGGLTALADLRSDSARKLLGQLK
jgi:von Willebrand factor type A domain